MEGNEVVERTISYIEDKPTGDRLYFRDQEAHEVLSNMRQDFFFLGRVLISIDPINPSELFGGTWELLPFHLFHSLYVYARVPEPVPVPPTDDNPDSGERITSYNQLTDKPSINGTTLQGALTSADIGIGEATDAEIDEITNE